MASRVQWFADRVRDLTVTQPIRAFSKSSAEAAGLAARAVKSKGSGALARDVSRPKPSGPLRAIVGSDLPYAGIQDKGGTIRPKSPGGRLLIRGKRGGRTRSSVGGPIVASADEVTIRPKNYLQVAERTFPLLYLSNLKRMMR